MSSAPNADKTSLSSKQLRIAHFVRPEEADFIKQLEYLRAYADLRTDRMAEVLTQAGGALPYFATVVGLGPSTKRYTHELLGIVAGVATQVVLQVKHALACHRPVAYSAQVQPVIPTPGHGTLPSGHATESYVTATVLAALQSGGSTVTQNMLLRQAGRIAQNRTVAGVHFPLDSVAGAMLGIHLGQYLVNRATDQRKLSDIGFDGRGQGDALFDPEILLSGTNGPILQELPGVSQETEVSIGTAPRFKSVPLGWLWKKAAEEWA